MIDPETRLFCPLAQSLEGDREQLRLNALAKLGALESNGVLVFDEAVQTAAHFLDIPICILGFFDRDRHWFKASVGLSRIGLMNELVTTRQLPRQESFCTQVLENQQAFRLDDVLAHPDFANRLLAQRYGIRAYLGVPLISSEGYCLGTLAVMDTNPHTFATKDINFLELVARWCMSEFERNFLLHQLDEHLADLASPNGDRRASTVSLTTLQSTKTALIAQMTQELCTPLTSILGMASVLTREIYGPLTEKQREYTNIVHTSSQQLLALVNEVLELGGLDDRSDQLNLTLTDIEMLCQQILVALDRVAQRREQQIQLTVEPGSRLWLLDKDKVRQILYQSLFNVIHSSSPNSTIRLHASRRQNQLSLSFWASHPWLGEGLSQAEIYTHQRLIQSAPSLDLASSAIVGWREWDADITPFPQAEAVVSIDTSTDSDCPKSSSSRQSLGLLLSHHLAELHNGSLSIQGSSEVGYRYVLRLPYLTEPCSHPSNSDT